MKKLLKIVFLLPLLVASGFVTLLVALLFAGVLCISTLPFSITYLIMSKDKRKEIKNKLNQIITVEIEDNAFDKGEENKVKKFNEI